MFIITVALAGLIVGWWLSQPSSLQHQPNGVRIDYASPGEGTIALPQDRQVQLQITRFFTSFSLFSTKFLCFFHSPTDRI